MKREPIIMPVLSDTMKTGHLSSWKKQVGDKIKKGDILAEVESDKAIMDVEAFSDGYLAAPLAQAGTDIPVGAEIGYIVDSPEAANADPSDNIPATDNTINQKESAQSNSSTSPGDSPAPTIIETDTQSITSQTTPVSPPIHTDKNKQQRLKISPYARGLAMELGIDPATISPGNDGVIRSVQVIKKILQGASPDLDAGPAWHYKLLTPMHRAIAENMSATVSTPTFRISSDISLKPLQDLQQKQPYSLSLLLSRALALSVKKHPVFNAVYTPNGLAVRKQVDVGIAMDIPGGLVTPVIRDAAIRPLDEMAEDWGILKRKAKSQRLSAKDYQGATVYLSNLGMFPQVISFEAVVPLGSAAIMAVGAARKTISRFTLSCDHRVVLGADAARFMETFAGLLATPKDLLK